MSAIKGNTRKGSLLKTVKREDDRSQKSGEIRKEDGASETTIPRLLRTKEAAFYLNLSVRTFTQYVLDYEIPFIEWSPRVRRFLVSDLDRIALSLRTKRQVS
ncbi:DNA-binding protein [Leptospira gomenensis]|uniref:DNA-binding protein n=1 Tax=Leptospira gomenensis TaxID=2484974 RepID=A0A5F1Z0V4_9LEPT|nr:DNA-binding protein [Leptospira gomenensis]TGK36052.1 DNA-binding protein [Leptospira gomenensis]TGK41798.1 DNA-binding protein [Leptospira gomenensis]TGK53345.1 DNA-binding protein [Leptospira gomenensis]TGK64951.1 DNA-binding protein [Leptospira gomenensis]